MPKLTKGQTAVYDVLKDWGPLPDHALVPLAQHAASVRLSSSGIRTRRHELESLGLVQATGNIVLTTSGRKATIWEVV